MAVQSISAEKSLNPAISEEPFIQWTSGPSKGADSCLFIPDPHFLIITNFHLSKVPVAFVERIGLTHRPFARGGGPLANGLANGPMDCFPRKTSNF
jgi:hypothetical protein